MRRITVAMRVREGIAAMESIWWALRERERRVALHKPGRAA